MITASGARNGAASEHPVWEIFMTDKVILLIEDNPDDQDLTLRALRKNQIKSRVVVVSDGAEALDYLFARGAHADRDVESDPNLVLLDLKLPKVDGLEVLEKLRQHERTRHLPVVVLTSSSQQSDICSAYNLGANSFIRKPVDFAEFTEAVRQLGLYWLGLNISPPTQKDF